MREIGRATGLIVKTGNPPAFKQEGFHSNVSEESLQTLLSI